MRTLRNICFWLAIISGFFLVAAVIFRSSCSSVPAGFAPLPNPDVPAMAQNTENYLRSTASTYLTYPEWWTVYSSQEYADYIAHNKPSGFPYFRSTLQFWSGYCTAYGLSTKYNTANYGNHLMLAVIGTSTSVEYAIKGIYENTIGRISEWLSFGVKTDEDIYAEKVAQEYAQFIPTQPWYDFPFGKKLLGVWTDTSFFEGSLVRNFERKFILSLEYGAKGVYAGVIRVGTHLVYGLPDDIDYMTVRASQAMLSGEPTVHIVKDLGNGRYIISTPHYQGFTDVIPRLSDNGVQFVEIGGTSEILVTALAPEHWSYNLPAGKVLFTVPILTNPGTHRLAIQAPVAHLAGILKSLQMSGVAIEHLYDY